MSLKNPKPFDPGTKSPYEILEVSETASYGEIRKAYLQKVRLSPPERDPEGFKTIRKAYGLLKDSVQRKKLDLSLFRKGSDLEHVQHQECDFVTLFEERIFHIFLVSSDLYVESFQNQFHDIGNEIRNLK